MGVSHAKSVAYLNQSHGQAQVARRQFYEKQQKIHLAHKRRKSFQEMWRAFQAHHDSPTPSGLSPRKMVFRRDLLRRGLLLSKDGMAMHAKEFFKRQETTACDIETRSIRRGSRPPPIEGTDLQYGHPNFRLSDLAHGEPIGTKFGEVVRYGSRYTYRVRVGSGVFVDHHKTMQLFPHELDLPGTHCPRVVCRGSLLVLCRTTLGAMGSTHCTRFWGCRQEQHAAIPWVITPG